MLVNEAILLSSMLDKINPASILDIGSGSRADREIVQPHIAAAYRGLNVHWTDANSFGGGRYADITNYESLADLPQCELVTACSVLEHVVDIKVAIDNLKKLTSKWLIVAVPHAYPIHNCPIDNGWRPSPQDLCDALGSVGLTVVESYLTEPENFAGVEGATATVVLACALKPQDTVIQVHNSQIGLAAQGA
jgi:hypothetical protein